MTGGVELLELVARRRALLQQLSAEPLEQAELVERVDASRSTVRRALQELEPAGLVRRGADGYETTLTGRLLVDLQKEYHDRARDVATAGDLLAALPASAPVDTRLVTGAERHRADEGLPDRLERALAAADRVQAVLGRATLPLDCWERRALGADLRLEVVLGEALYDQLSDGHPDLLRTHAATGNAVHVGSVPRFDLLVVDRGEKSLVAVVPHADTLGEGVTALCNDTPAAVEWGRERFERTRAAATDAAADARGLSATADGGTGDPERVLAASGFETVTAERLDACDPAPLPTGWRAGLTLGGVEAGHAVDREYVVGGRTDGAGGTAVGGPGVGPSPDRAGPAVDAPPGERRDLAADLFAGLANGTHHALIGPPGSGKSTVCRQVAAQWVREQGPVLYRSTGDPFEAPAALLERVATLEDTVLVVVEDAVRPDAAAVFEALADAEGVVFLFDAVEGEWSDPPADVPPAADAARLREVRAVPMPPLDERAVARFIDRLETTTDRTVETDPADLLAAVRAADGGTGAAPGEVLLLLHRLTRRAAADDPADGTVSRPTPDDRQTTLDAAVSAAYREVAAAGEEALRAGIAVNLLNAAGVAVRPAVVHAVGEATAVETALDALAGRALFPVGTDDPATGFRTVHEAWSQRFLEQLLADRGDAEAAAMFGDVIGELLALADDPARRERAASKAGDPEALADVATAPREWAEGLLESVFRVGREHPALAPLYGDSDAIAMPEVAPPDLAARVTLWRGLMRRAAGDLEDATTAFERVPELVEATPLDGDTAAELRARALTERGMTAYRQGDADAAEADFRASLDRYEELGDRKRVAENRQRLGNVAWMRGNLQVAEDRYRAALSTYRELDDPLGVAYVRHNLGNVIDARGDADAAEEHYRAALSIYRRVGDRRDEADCLNNLGVLAENRGDLDAAADYYARARQRHREVGAEVGIANATHNLGIVAHRRGDLEAAAERATEALERFEATGDEGGVVVATRLLAAVERESGDLDAAADHADRSQTLAENLGDRKEYASATLERARIARKRGDLETARSLAETALATERDLGQPRGEATAMKVLAAIERETDDFEAAHERLATALSLVEELADDARAAGVYDEAGRLDRERGRPAAAAERFGTAADLFAGAGADARAIDARLRQAEALATAGEDGAACERVRRARERAADAGLNDRRERAAARLAALTGDEG